MRQINAIRVLCVDDHPVVRHGLNAIIGLQSDMEVVGECADAATAVESFRAIRPDVTLMDLHLPDRSGIEATREICKEYSDAKIIVLTTYSSEEHIRGAIDAGACGYLLKESLRTELLDSIREVNNGLRCIPKELTLRLNDSKARPTMTPREHQVLSLMSKGYRNRKIAEALAIAEETVKSHVKSILCKLEAEDRTHAIVNAIRRGIINVD